jgi:hypothetical protein
MEGFPVSQLNGGVGLSQHSRWIDGSDRHPPHSSFSRLTREPRLVASTTTCSLGPRVEPEGDEGLGERDVGGGRRSSKPAQTRRHSREGGDPVRSASMVKPWRGNAT